MNTRFKISLHSVDLIKNNVQEIVDNISSIVKKINIIKLHYRCDRY